ncbi:MAG: siderophore-interacting protein [Ilumatobacteraceae bacterium]
MSDPTDPSVRLRREPPPLEPATVIEREERSPRLVRLTFEGAAFASYPDLEPGGSIRLLVPGPVSTELVMPTWNGNEFLLPDGTRPILRTFTPLHLDRDGQRLELEIVRHPGGAVSAWAEQAAPGDRVAMSGPGAGYELEPDVLRYLLVGDETAMPAIGQLIALISPSIHVDAHLEVVDERAILETPWQENAHVRWHVREPGEAPGAQLVEVVRRLEDVPDSMRVWAAGEAASMQAMRNHLFKALGVPRSRCSIRGYWKPATPTE